MHGILMIFPLYTFTIYYIASFSVLKDPWIFILIILLDYFPAIPLLFFFFFLFPLRLTHSFAFAGVWSILLSLLSYLLYSFCILVYFSVSLKIFEFI